MSAIKYIRYIMTLTVLAFSGLYASLSFAYPCGTFYEKKTGQDKPIVFEQDPNLLCVRFSIIPVQGKIEKEVSVEHAFYTGDRFRFTIRSNKNAYLSVVNITAKGQAQLIWPPASSFDKTDNLILAEKRTYFPLGGSFKFAGASGEDWLLLVLSPDKERPDLAALQKDIDTYRANPGKVVEYRPITDSTKAQEPSNKNRRTITPTTKPSDTTTKLESSPAAEKKEEKVVVAKKEEEEIPFFNPRSIGQVTRTSTPTVDDPGTYAAQTTKGKVVLVFPYLLVHKPR